MPSSGFSSLSGTASQSISSRTKSSESLALIGPPNTTTPAWPASVSGSGSPKRGRRTSIGMPRLQMMADATRGRALLMENEENGLGHAA